MAYQTIFANAFSCRNNTKRLFFLTTLMFFILERQHGKWCVNLNISSQYVIKDRFYYFLQKNWPPIGIDEIITRVDITLNIAYSKWYVKEYAYVTRHQDLLVLVVMPLDRNAVICEIFIKWDGLSCPCCGYKLRNGPRSFKFKAKLRIKKKQKENQLPYYIASLVVV